MRGKGLGTCARQLVAEVATIKSLDVVLPVRTAEGTVDVRLHGFQTGPDGDRVAATPGFAAVGVGTRMAWTEFDHDHDLSPDLHATSCTGRVLEGGGFRFVVSTWLLTSFTPHALSGAGSDGFFQEGPVDRTGPLRMCMFRLIGSS